MRCAAANRPFSSILIFLFPQHRCVGQLLIAVSIFRDRGVSGSPARNLCRMLMGFLMAVVDEETFKTSHLLKTSAVEEER